VYFRNVVFSSVDRQHILDYHVRIVHELPSTFVVPPTTAFTLLSSSSTVKKEQEKATPLRAPASFVPDIMSPLALGDAGISMEFNFVDAGAGPLPPKEEEPLERLDEETLGGGEKSVRRKGERMLYRCPKCRFVTSNVTNAGKHARQHGAMKRYVCRHCDYSLDRQRHLVDHILLHHSVNHRYVDSF